ncbi:MAG: hypothetical protein WKF51_12560 [Geodermatophilaceae bacterium]
MRNVAPLLAGSIGLSGCGSDPETAGGSGGGSAAVPDAPSAGQVLFEDAFDEDRNGWALPENESGRTYFEEGDFVWESRIETLRPHVLATPLGEAFDAGELEMLDVVVRASATPTQGAAAVGVFCREIADTDADFQWYEFVARDGYAAIRLADSEGSLDVLATTEDLELPSGEQFTVEAACVDDDQGQAQLWLTVNDTLVLHTTQSDPLGNGVAVLQAYDAPESASEDCFVIRWHDFTVLQPGNGPWMLGAACTSVASAVTTAARRCSGTIGGRKVELCGKALPDDVLLTVQGHSLAQPTARSGRPR